MRGSEILTLIEEHDAEICAAIVACAVQSVKTRVNTVLLVLESENGIPVAFVPLSCVHGVESVINRLHLAAHDAFKDQPCTICEKVESMRRDEIAVLIGEHDAKMCAATITVDVHNLASETNHVLLVLGSAEGVPVAFAPLSCVHGVETVIEKLHLAAREAFSNQPCTICERVE